MKTKQSVPPLFGLGMIFLAMGFAGRRTFLVLGIVFLSIGVALIVSQQRGNGSK